MNRAIDRRRLWLLAAALPALLLAGCAAHADRLRQVRGEFYANNLDPRGSSLKGSRKDYGGRPTTSSSIGRWPNWPPAGRRKPNACSARSATLRLLRAEEPRRKAAVMLTDDTHAAYAGEDYEKVLIRAFLAISNLMSGGDDATAYSLQADDMQERIIQTGGDESGQNPKLNYKRIALGAYLHGMLREATHTGLQRRRAGVHPGLQLGAGVPLRPTRLRPRHARPSHAPRATACCTFSPLSAAGRTRSSATRFPTQLSLLIADRIISATGRHTLPPTIAPVKVPIVVPPRNV